MLFILLNIGIQSQSYPKFHYFDIKKLNLNELLLNEADTWKGVKYVWGGTTRKGVDCSAFVRNVYKNSLNISLPRTSRQQYNNTCLVEPTNKRVGDLVFFFNSKGVHHVGIIYGEGKFIHASSSRGVRVDSLEEGYWSKKKKTYHRII